MLNSIISDMDKILRWTVSVLNETLLQEIFVRIMVVVLDCYCSGLTNLCFFLLAGREGTKDP
uniref:Uncharacterized protein n=1 Tax=Solanum tuberosum TaxID=4113 RepID=M1CSZ4_SOLTU